MMYFNAHFSRSWQELESKTINTQQTWEMNTRIRLNVNKFLIAPVNGNYYVTMAYTDQ